MDKDHLETVIARLAKRIDALESDNQFVTDVREAMNKSLGDDDIASLLESLHTDMTQAIRILTREGFAEEDEFKTVLDE